MPLIHSPESTDLRPSDGVGSDAFTQNALCLAGTAGLAGVAVGSVALTATLLPAQTICLAAVSGGALYWGNHLNSTDA